MYRLFAAFMAARANVAQKVNQIRPHLTPLNACPLPPLPCPGHNKLKSTCDFNEVKMDESSS